MNPLSTKFPTYQAAGATSQMRENSATVPPTYLRPTLLFLISVITVGSHYGKHALSSLGSELMRDLGVERTKFGLLFSSQEIPGIILPVVGGLALTYVPHGPAAVVLASVIFLSTMLGALAVARASYTLLFVGRFLFGLSDGALTTLQGALIAHWFKSKAGSGFGVMLLVSRLSSFLGLSLPAFISARYGLQFSMWFSVFVCIPPLLSTIAYSVIDARYSSHDPLPQDESSGSLQGLLAERANRQFSSGYRGFLDLLKSFPLPFWIVSYLWIAVAGSVFSMLHFAPDAFSSHFGLSASVSGLMSGTLLLAAGLASPTLGVVQDKVGRRPAILAWSCGLICVGILVSAYAVSTTVLSTKIVVITGLCLIAAGFAAAPVTLMSCVALSVDDFVTPTALGLYKATENAGLAVLHVLTGALRDESNNYGPSFVLLAALAASGVAAAAYLGRISPILRLKADEIPSQEMEDGDT